MAVTYRKTLCSLFLVASSLFFVFLVIINIQFFIYLLSTSGIRAFFLILEGIVSETREISEVKSKQFSLKGLWVKH
jgi:hypothetical protein